MLMKPMCEVDFESFIGQSIADYAQDLQRTYRYESTKALACAKGSVDELLPAGPNTDGHVFFNLYSETGTRVGYLWLEVRSELDAPMTLFICELEIHSAFRRQGWGRRALIEVEQWAVARGIHRVELNVFADNDSALALYRSQAFVPCEITMGKNLG